MSCGSTRNTNASAINLNAQPGNIINTPNADDGEILVFVESADGLQEDCSGALGTWQNFKPLLFDIRSNTGHKYVDIGVSTATSSGGSYPVISYFHRITSSAYSYDGVPFMGVASANHNQGLFGINTISKVDGGDDGVTDALAKALAHLHIYSAIGPSLYLESGSTSKDPMIWMRMQGNKLSAATASGYSVYSQRRGLVHSFEQADSASPHAFAPDAATYSLLQIWKKDIVGSGASQDPVITIGKLASGDGTSYDYDTVLGGSRALGNLQINAAVPSLLIRGGIDTGSNSYTYDGSGGLTDQTAPSLKLVTPKKAFIRFKGTDAELHAAGHASIYYNYNAATPANSTLNFVVYDSSPDSDNDTVLQLTQDTTTVKII